MTILQATLLGLVQGLTEFLPISSTAHLLLVPSFLGWQDPGAAFSATIQLGTLAAVFVYFAADIRRLLGAAFHGLIQRNLGHSTDSIIAWSIVTATIPVAALGLGLRDFIDSEFRSLPVVVAALIVLAIMLLVAERLGNKEKPMASLRFWQIQFIGLCQTLALIPGCSRSGSTIMGGLFIGLKRDEAARFSFILGLPAIGGSGMFKLIELMQSQPDGAAVTSLAVGILVAAVSGYLTIGFLLRFLQRHGTHWFAYYRIALGIVILSSVYPTVE